MSYPSEEEMQALANDLLNTPEACLPWEPIPARFSGAWQVGVTHVTEYSQDQPPAEYFTIALTAYCEASDPLQKSASSHVHETGAWRIDFIRCEAYRKRVVDYTGSAPLTRPDRDRAFWEITGSHYLVESGVWAAYYPTPFHHYVILSDLTTAYEVLASGWRCTPLAPEWAKTGAVSISPWPSTEA
jgi:hypothetical protein